MNIDLWRKRKKELGWTLDELADYAKVSRRTVARIFSPNTNANPNLYTVQAIERALGLIPAITDEEYAAGLRATRYASITANDQEVLDVYHDIIKKHGADKHDTVIKVLEMLRGGDD